MKKEPIHNCNYVLALALTTAMLCQCACTSTSRTITGKVTDLQGNTVTVDNTRKFKVYDTAGLYIGKQVTFTPTVTRKKINSKRLK